MLLPCPHCKRQFKLAVEQIKSETVKVKCPTCGGIFVIQLSHDAAAGYDSQDVKSDSGSQDVTTGDDSQDVASDSDSQDVTSDSGSQDVTTGDDSQDVASDSDSQDVASDSDSQDVTTGDDSQDVTSDSDSQDVTAGSHSQDVTTGNDSLDVSLGKDLPDPSPSVPAPEGLPAESGNNGSHAPISSDIAASLAIEEDLFHDPSSQPSELSLIRRIISPRYLYGLLALTSVFLLVFLLNIGSSNRPPSSRDAEDKVSANLASVTMPEEKPVSGDVPVGEEETKAPAWDLISKDPITRAFWSSSSLEAEDPCALLPSVEADTVETEEQDPCQHYPQWIAYLVLENAATPVCKLETTFNHAKAAGKDEILCGQGYAFLAAYYVQKKIIGQSHSYLETALELSPQSPWVRVVEALFYEKIRNDRGKALSTLQELDEKSPGFSLARYLLAKIYIKQEEYKKADPIFRFLQREYAEQDAFGKIRQSLVSIDEAPYYSTVKAKGLLDLSRDFSELRDRPMAEHLCRKVLEEMSGRLPEEERKAAYCELGQIYESRGDKSSAYDSYRNALKIDPKFQDARERLDHLL